MSGTAMTATAEMSSESRITILMKILVFVDTGVKTLNIGEEWILK
jgi:hypothetical protein